MVKTTTIKYLIFKKLILFVNKRIVQNEKKICFMVPNWKKIQIKYCCIKANMNDGEINHRKNINFEDKKISIYFVKYKPNIFPKFGSL